MTDRHKKPPVSFRPSEADRRWLAAEAERTGQPISRIIARALALLREQEPDR